MSPLLSSGLSKAIVLSEQLPKDCKRTLKDWLGLAVSLLTFGLTVRAQKWRITDNTVELSFQVGCLDSQDDNLTWSKGRGGTRQSNRMLEVVSYKLFEHRKSFVEF